MKIVVLLRGLRGGPAAPLIEDRLGQDERAALNLALELARSTPGSHSVTALTVGDDPHDAVLRYASARGADALVRLWDKQIGDVDFQGIALGIVATLRHLGFDLILAGRQSEDLSLGSVGPAVADGLDVPHLNAVHRIEISSEGAALRAERFHLGRLYAHILPLPSLLTVVPAPGDTHSVEPAPGPRDREDPPVVQRLNLRDVGMDAALLESRRPLALHPQPQTPPSYETAWAEDVETVGEHLADLGLLLPSSPATGP